MKYAVEVAKAGSLSKASERLYVAPPNISRCIRELETDLGITIFERTAKGVTLTADGEEFIHYAKGLLSQIAHIENRFREGTIKKQKFSISVPRACYIAEAFTEFTKQLSQEPAEVFYKETNSQRTIHNVLNHDYKLGIIRYAQNYERFFMAMLEEKGLCYENVTEFSYVLLMSREHPLAGKEEIALDDLTQYVEIAHADPYVPSLPISKVVKEELPDNIARRIFIFERASQFDLLSRNQETFMWVSPTPQSVQNRYDLVQKHCGENKKIYKDILIYRKDYKLTELDRRFIAELNASIQKHL